MAEQNEKPATPENNTVNLNIRLQPVDDSDLPVLSNFVRLNGAPGMVFVDFGFLEPSALTALSQLARTGGKIPETLQGKLAVRIALGFDAVAGLHQQLGQVLANIQAQAQQRTEKPAAPPAKDGKR